MTKLKLIMTVSLLTFLLIACNSDGENETVPEEGDSITDEEENNGNTEEDDDVEDTSEKTDSDTDDTSNESSAAGDGETLSLGETATIETNYGDFEITFESFQFLDELEGETPSSGILVLMDATVTNIGDQAIMGSDFYTAALFDDRGIMTENAFFYETIDQIEDTLEPGDTTEGQFIFDTAESEYYELVYNLGFSAVATEVTWEFTADEASNE